MNKSYECHICSTVFDLQPEHEGPPVGRVQFHDKYPVTKVKCPTCGNIYTVDSRTLQVQS